MAEEEKKQDPEKSEEDLMKEWEESGTDGRTLNQDEIDSLLGFDAEGNADSQTGIQALLDKSLLTYQRLPMLEVVFDRFVRILSTTLRNFTSDSVDIDIHSITSLRFGDYTNSIPMPAILTIFKAVEWENYGLITLDGSLIYSMVDVLFGGRRSTRPIRIEGRPYTTIEQAIVKYISQLMLNDLSASFDLISPVSLHLERLETNPRFASIARPADASILLQLRVDMEERGGNIEVLFPNVTLEPIKDLLSQVFMGEKFGKDSVWETHFGNEVYKTTVEIEARLKKQILKLRDIVNLKVGSTLITNNEPDDDIKVLCQNTEVFSGLLGESDDKLAIKVRNVLNKKMKEVLDQ